MEIVKLLRGIAITGLTVITIFIGYSMSINKFNTVIEDTTHNLYIK